MNLVGSTCKCPEAAYVSHEALHVLHGDCRMEQKTPLYHLPLHWMMPLTPQLPQQQPCPQAPHQKRKKMALLPMASICQMARVSLTAMASDASTSAVQPQTAMLVLGQDVQSINTQMTASGASCLPPFLPSITCGGTVEEVLSKHEQQTFND